ncbi:MAG TPA: murein biosynthesis integral membrane protein MurJ [Aggregatilineaceae bacterium]|nr:murein biosynthesis integral membrane protein MurJ [Aggregatilineaceae bacterium]
MDAAISEPLSNEIQEPSAGMLRATSVLALGNVASRVIGLLREMILSALFGAGAAVDAFNLAIIVPRGLYDLLIGGHVNSALIPVLSEYAAHEDRRDLWDLVNALLGLVVVALAVLILVIEIFAPQIIGIVASDEATAQVVDKATHLLRVTAPALMFLSLFAVLSGVLYALRRFTWPAFASTVFNGMIVLVTLAFHKQIGITAAAVGWLVGAAVQLVLQAPGLRDARLRIKLRGAWSHPGVRTIGVLYVPVMASLALDVLINRPFSYNLASSTGEGSISYMNWATTLLQFPQGLVAIAISVAILPTLSRQAGLQPFKDTLGQGLRLSIVLIIPATVGLFVLAHPVVSLLFEHGEFNSTDTAFTALALRLYLLGLPFAAVDLLLIFAFYARQNTLIPALVGLLSLVAYMVVAVVLLPWYSFFALMVADSVKFVIHTGVSAWLLYRTLKGYGNQRLISTTVRAALAATGMGVLIAVLAAGLDHVLPEGFIYEAAIVGTTGSLGLISYSVLATRLGLSEWQWMLKMLRQKIGF